MNCRRFCRSQFCTSLVLAVTCAFVNAGGTPGASTKQLYWLAGTPTNYSDDHFPVSLYRVKATKKLDLVRTVVPASEGLYSVQTAEGVIFVAHPAGTPASVSIVHTSDPQLKDDVPFKSDDDVSVRNREALAEPTSSSIDALFALTAAGSDASKGTLISVSSEPGETARRLRPNAWDEYSSLRLDGNPGGRPSMFFAVSAGWLGGAL